MTFTEGVWLPISEYSRYKNISVSTIRRHIKGNVLKYKEENGKYLIYVPSVDKIISQEEEELLRAKLELELLKNQIRILSEENNELRMLVELYEKNQLTKEDPPEIPKIL